MRIKLCFMFGVVLTILPIAAHAANLGYTGEVTEALGAFDSLTPVGTPVGGPIEVDGAALAAGAIGIGDIISINVNVGNFCFATEGGDCGGVGAVVPILSIDSAAITGSSGKLGGSFQVTAHSPTVLFVISISFNLDNETFFAQEAVLGSFGGTGALKVLVDSDGDRVTDDVDNCTFIRNPDQSDTNGDGIGNQCDADVNDDCIVNFIDVALFTPRFNTGVGDPSYDEDFDIDGSGALNHLDYFAYVIWFLQPPGPSANDCASRVAH